MTNAKSISLSRQSNGQCPLRNINALLYKRYVRKSRREIFLAIILDVFSNFSLKG